MPTIEYIGTEYKCLEVHSLGALIKGDKVLCPVEVANEFKDDKRFKIEGLKMPKTKKGER